MARINVDLDTEKVEVCGSTSDIINCINIFVESMKTEATPMQFRLFKFSLIHSLLLLHFSDVEVIECMQRLERIKSDMEKEIENEE